MKSQIANRKSHSDCCACGRAVPLALARRIVARAQANTPASKAAARLNGLRGGRPWTCKKCGHKNFPALEVCGNCGFDRFAKTGSRKSGNVGRIQTTPGKSAPSA